MNKPRILIALLACTLYGGAQAASSTTITMHAVDKDGVGDSIGQITATQTDQGVMFTPNLKDLDEGLHGFHVHQNGSCQPGTKDGKTVAALAAGGHYDPENSGHHGTPWGDGHLGDLPALYVNGDGDATHPVLAPRLTLSDLKGHALMIHENGDNYADQPKPLGGGGGRAVCGVAD